MKFTNGYWQLREEITPNYAVEVYDHEINGKELVLYAPCKHIGGRGDVLNRGMLTIKLTSPIENVIKVSVTHFAGAVYKGPFAKVYETDPEVTITQDEHSITYQSGTLKAVVCTDPSAWEITFYEGDKKLTDTGFRNMAHMSNRENGKTYMLEQLALGVGESVYGLGERFTPFVRNGQVVEMWNEDGGTASEISYKNLPFYITSGGYGVLVDDEGDVAFEIGSEKVERIQFSKEGERLDYYLIGGGTPMRTVELYNELTGKPALPPAWSFGLWLTTSFTTNYDEKTTASFIDGMAQRDIPLHVFHFDSYWMKGFEWVNLTWDPETFPDPEGMLKRYHEKGLKICVWINSYIAQKSPLFAEAAQHGYLIKKKDGGVWQTDLWQGGMGIVDFTNPAATEWYLSKLKVLLDMGVDCFKTDFGERIPVKDIEYFDGSDPVKMHNYYTHLYNEAVFGLLERERGIGEAVVFARSATTGGQQFPAHWGGDCSATYQSMAETLRGGLSMACSGFSFWSHDISGFEQTAPADIYKRWCQFGLLSSHSRLHGSTSYRVPWLFDDEACDVLRKFTKLKCTLMPYLYAQAVRSHKEGRPILRPMMMDFTQDRTCHPLDMQYMLGDSLLVAPIFREDGQVEYYLPKGRWYNLLTDRMVDGEKWHTETHDYFSLPLMVRPGSILAIGPNDQRPDYDYSEDVCFALSDFEDGVSAETFVTDVKGNVIRTVRAERSGQRITVSVDGGSENWTAKLLGRDVKGERIGNKMIFML